MNTTRSPGGCLLGVVVFIIGVPLLFIIPIGTVFGVFLLILSPFLTRKVARVWRCTACRSIIPRA